MSLGYQDMMIEALKGELKNMILCDRSIMDLIKQGTLISVDYKDLEKGYNYKDGIQPASYDLRLGNNYIDKSYNDANQEVCIIDDNGIMVPPHGFILMTTMEFVKIPDNICAFLEGRSSVGRTGIFIHNAGLIDPGFNGQITLEIYNATHSSVKLKPGMRICQIVFHTMDRPCDIAYNGKYQNQKGTTVSKLYLDKEMN